MIVDSLQRFYNEFKVGATVDRFLEEYSCLVQSLTSDHDVRAFRLGKGNFKRLRDEIAPLAHFVKQQHSSSPGDTIQFPFDCGPVDCNLRQKHRQRKFQVTIAQGHERYFTMSELNETGTGRAFLGLTDDQPWLDFTETMSQPRRAYGKKEALDANSAAIKRCIEKKQKITGADTLLIEAPLLTLPNEAWLEMIPSLQETAKNSNFDEIFVIGDAGRPDYPCFQIR